MAQQLVPYSFSGIAEYPQTHQSLVPGQIQGVYISIHPDHLESILSKIVGWFSGRPEIDMVDAGASDKQGQGFIIIEWIEREIDPLFLAILRDEHVVADYTTYGRELEG